MIKALLFDVFGTLVDWRSSVARLMAPFTDEGAAFADAWRGRYQPSMEAVRSGQRPFVPLDTLHRESLDATLDEFGLSAGVFTTDLARAHRVAAAFEAGTVWINQYNLTPAGMPFGGSKASGIGRENARMAMDHYTEAQTVYVGMSPVEAAF